MYIVFMIEEGKFKKTYVLGELFSRQRSSCYLFSDVTYTRTHDLWMAKSVDKFVVHIGPTPVHFLYF
jgi:hypothetical protein